jgi:hypothetical protein
MATVIATATKLITNQNCVDTGSNHLFPIQVETTGLLNRQPATGALRNND